MGFTTAWAKVTVRIISGGGFWVKCFQTGLFCGIPCMVFYYTGKFMKPTSKKEDEAFRKRMRYSGFEPPTELERLKFWEHIAPKWDVHWDDPLQSWRGKVVPKGENWDVSTMSQSHVLDLCCGTAKQTVYMKKYEDQIDSITLVDVVPAMLVQAKIRVDRHYPNGEVEICGKDVIGVWEKSDEDEEAIRQSVRKEMEILVEEGKTSGTVTEESSSGNSSGSRNTTNNSPNTNPPTDEEHEVEGTEHVPSDEELEIRGRLETEWEERRLRAVVSGENEKPERFSIPDDYWTKFKYRDSATTALGKLELDQEKEQANKKERLANETPEEARARVHAEVAKEKEEWLKAEEKREEFRLLALKKGKEREMLGEMRKGEVMEIEGETYNELGSSYVGSLDWRPDGARDVKTDAEKDVNTKTNGETEEGGARKSGAGSEELDKNTRPQDLFSKEELELLEKRALEKREKRRNEKDGFYAKMVGAAFANGGGDGGRDGGEGACCNGNHDGHHDRHQVDVEAHHPTLFHQALGWFSMGTYDPWRGVEEKAAEAAVSRSGKDYNREKDKLKELEEKRRTMEENLEESSREFAELQGKGKEVSEVWPPANARTDVYKHHLAASEVKRRGGVMGLERDRERESSEAPVEKVIRDYKRQNEKLKAPIDQFKKGLTSGGTDDADDEEYTDFESRPIMTLEDEAAGDDGVQLGRLPIRLECCDAADLPYPDNSFDTIIMQQCLCSTEQPELALLEASRVLKPEGKIYLQEHGRSRWRLIQWYQDYFDHHDQAWAWKHGCYNNRLPLTLVQKAGCPIYSYSTSNASQWYRVVLGKSKRHRNIQRERALRADLDDDRESNRMKEEKRIKGEKEREGKKPKKELVSVVKRETNEGRNDGVEVSADGGSAAGGSADRGGRSANSGTTGSSNTANNSTAEGNPELEAELLLAQQRIDQLLGIDQPVQVGEGAGSSVTGLPSPREISAAKAVAEGRVGPGIAAAAGA